MVSLDISQKKKKKIKTNKKLVTLTICKKYCKIVCGGSITLKIVTLIHFMTLIVVSILNITSNYFSKNI